MFKKKKQSRTKLPEAILLYKNNHVDNIYEACTCCYDNTKKLNYFQKKEYIAKRIIAGHESILEHGRLALKIINIRNSSLIAELTTYEYAKYLQFYSIHNEDNSYTLIINGNMRSYKYFITNTSMYEYDNNFIIRYIFKILQENTVKELYGDTDLDFVDIETIDNDVLDFNPELDKNGLYYQYTHTQNIFGDMKTTKMNKSIDIGYDFISYRKLKEDSDIPDELIEDIIPVTVVFKNMSRTATHQLVRHRNAITQESQRYVTYKDADFTIPVPDYNNEKKYKISLFGQVKEINLSDLATEMMSVYEQLQKAGLKKEEARAYLPQNVNCKRLYMTFSLSNLYAFLGLRTDEHAQYEIRQYALTIKALVDTI